MTRKREWKPEFPNPSELEIKDGLTVMREPKKNTAEFKALRRYTVIYRGNVIELVEKRKNGKSLPS